MYTETLHHFSGLEGENSGLVKLRYASQEFQPPPVIIVTLVLQIGSFEISYKVFSAFSPAGGRVPVDGVKITQKIYHEGIKTTVSFYVLASSGILLCLFCLLFNFKYRNHR